MTRFDDLGPQDYEHLMSAFFTPNQRKIIESTPPHERAALDQALTRRHDRQHTDPREQAEFEAAMAAITPDQWAALEADLRETEREILRERGIEPE